MKKVISAALAAIMLVGIMSGCKGNGKDSENGESVTLKVYMPGKEQKDMQLVVDEASKITEREIGAKLDLVFIDDGSYSEKMNMKLATKEDFDICWTSSWLNPYSKGVTNESYYPLTELINEYVPDMWDMMPQWWWDGVRVDGEIYAVPNQQIAGGKRAITMNTDWVKKYNLDVASIKTIDDIEPFLQQVKENEPDYYPTRPYDNYWVSDYESIVSCIGIDTSTDDYKAIFEWDAKGYKHGLEKLNQWYQKGYFRQDVASVMDDTSDFKANKYIMTGTNWAPGFEASQAGQLGGEHIAIPLYESYITSQACQGTMYAISAFTKHPEKAIKYLELVNTNKELYNLLSFGIEGKHYQREEDGRIKCDPNSGYYTNQSWKFGCQFNAEVQVGQDLDVWEQTKKINDESKVSKLMGFVFDSSKVRTEISQLSTVKSEYKNLTTNGVMKVEEHYDEYIEKMKNAGAESLLAEVQRQLDEFAKTKQAN